jgi:glutamate-1-semialdehyde 2,1-aminomutase
MTPSWQHTKQDKAFFQRELDAFVPQRIFDSHIHLGPRRDYIAKHADLVANTPEIADKITYLADISWLLPQRNVVGAMAIPNILGGPEIERGNQYVAREWPESHALMVPPTSNVDDILNAISATGPKALKCYHLLSDRKNTMDSALEEFLPETTVAAAHEARLPIIVHLVRPRALGDMGNQEAVNRLCRKYPNMNMILAHMGRGFNPHHTIDGIKHVSGLDNLYFDTSCVTECGAMEAVLRVYGPERLMWGSDYPFSHFHGRCICINDNFVWLYDDNFDPAPLSPDPKLEFSLVGLESLRCLKVACQHCDLSDSQVEAIFCDNALSLFGQLSS